MAGIIEVLKAERDRLVRDDLAADDEFPTPLGLLRRVADLNRRIEAAQRYLAQAGAELDLVTTGSAA